MTNLTEPVSRTAPSLLSVAADHKQGLRINTPVSRAVAICALLVGLSVSASANDGCVVPKKGAATEQADDPWLTEDEKRDQLYDTFDKSLLTKKKDCKFEAKKPKTAAPKKQDATTPKSEQSPQGSETDASSQNASPSNSEAASQAQSGSETSNGQETSSQGGSGSEAAQSAPQGGQESEQGAGPAGQSSTPSQTEAAGNATGEAAGEAGNFVGYEPMETPAGGGTAGQSQEQREKSTSEEVGSAGGASQESEEKTPGSGGGGSETEGSNGSKSSTGNAPANGSPTSQASENSGFVGYEPMSGSDSGTAQPRNGPTYEQRPGSAGGVASAGEETEGKGEGAGGGGITTATRYDELRAAQGAEAKTSESFSEKYGGGTGQPKPRSFKDIAADHDRDKAIVKSGRDGHSANTIPTNQDGNSSTGRSKRADPTPTQSANAATIKALEERLETEEDPEVRKEIEEQIDILKK